MSYSRAYLGEMLVNAGMITEEQLLAALESQRTDGGKLGEVLVRELVLTEDQIAEALANQKGYEHINLAGTRIDPAAAMLLPLGMARRRGVIPIEISGDTVTLAMADPLDVEAIDETEIRTGLKVRPVVAAAGQVTLAIEKYIAGGDALMELGMSGSDDSDEDVDSEGLDLEVPVVRVVNQLIQQAVNERASDIHFEPMGDGIVVRFRVDGVLREAARLPKQSQAELLSRIKVMADLDITERRRPQDGRIGLRSNGRALDLRVATLPTPLGESIVLRVLDAEVAFHSLDDIGLVKDDYERLMEILRKPYGALFVSGPTGSGKSTTLYAILSEIVSPERKVITVEDPIEYQMPGITQVAVNTRVGLTFAAGLRTILRADPDIVMVGEVRDPETGEIAVRAALTGHLVLSSIHTNDAPSALTRLNDMGIPPYITSSALLGALAQRLVRKLCPYCKQPVEMTPERLAAAGFRPAEVETVVPYGPVGCPECDGTGYRGRVGVFEIMAFDEQLASLFVSQATAEKLRHVAIGRGMKPMRRDALDKVAAGITSLDEVDRVVV